MYLFQEADLPPAPEVDDGAAKLFHVKGSSEDCCKGIEVCGEFAQLLQNVIFPKLK